MFYKLRYSVEFFLFQENRKQFQRQLYSPADRKISMDFFSPPTYLYSGNPA